MPALSRSTYRRELITAALFPWILASVEGGVIGFIVRRLFDGVVPDLTLNYVVATLVAVPALANISSFVWVRLSHGRAKVRFINGMQIALVVLATLIAVTPITPFGLVMVTLTTIGARVCLAGIVTLRSIVWGQNYPREDRARAIGKITTVQVLIVAFSAIGLGLVMERLENSFRMFIPGAALLALVGVRVFSGVRVRGERSLIRAERDHAHGERPSLNPFALRRILIEDSRYDAYMACQNLMGLGNMMTWAPVVIMVKERFGAGYFTGVLITQAIPLLMMPLFIPGWSRVMGRVHIVSFRAIHSWIFALMAILMLCGGQLGWLWLVALGAVVKGIGFGGGALAWNLGHHDFAPADKASQYMSIHVTLTGLRGLAAPYLGVSLYQVFEMASPGDGPWVFGVAAVLIVAGALGFAVLHRSMTRRDEMALEPA